MSRLLDSLFAFCASLKLAVIVILTLAGLLAVATFYEARYGTPAVQELVYGSPLFLGTLALLATNVMAAALIRYPWKRKQTGFVVTHLGILTLLAGCLLSFRMSVDGRLTLSPGDSAKDFALVSERLQLTLAGKTYALPATFWREAGYPSLTEALTFRWPEYPPVWRGPNPRFVVAPDVSLEVLEWLPAARPSGPMVPPVLANVPSNKLVEAPRAAKLALTVDGQRTESWILRGAPATPLQTAQGQATLAYGFQAGDLPFSISLLSTEKTTNPGTNDPATYTSAVLFTLADGSKPRQIITMNNPAQAGGYTFYQSSFEDPPPNTPNAQPLSTLAIRKDPGTLPKYAGSALICLGIFLMFYMKAYFQKPTAAALPVQSRSLSESAV